MNFQFHHTPLAFLLRAVPAIVGYFHRVLKARLLDGHRKMRDRLLFHLSLVDGPGSSLEHADKRLSAVPTTGLPTTADSKVVDNDTTTAAAAAIKAPSQLSSTCIHSSSPATVAIGFKQGVVHVYRREASEDNGKPGCKEEEWKRSVVYPTRALSPTSSAPSGVPPDITCVALSPGEDMLAVGTSDGFVFVSQVSCEWW